MSMTIKFSADEECRIRRRALRAGLTPDEYIRKRLTTSSSRKNAPQADLETDIHSARPARYCGMN